MRNVLEIVEDADKYRSSVINLQASENVISPAVRRAIASDFASRYSHLENGVNDYGGTKYAEELENAVAEKARILFGFSHAETRTLSGHIAAMTVLAALVKRGESIMKMPESVGGYTGYSNAYLPRMMGFKAYDIPVDANGFIDYNGLEKQAEYIKPKMIVLGQSIFVKSYDLSRIREICDRHSCIIGYDASHVMGLIAGKQFQRDIKKADVVFGSTHKTFFGPQGGLILTDNEGMFKRIEENVTWRTMDNYNIARMAGVGVAIEEMIKYGQDYAQRVIKNSRTLAEAINGKIRVKHDPWFTESHQILLDGEWLKSQGYDYVKFSKTMESNGIVVDRIGRIGTAEITRMGVDDMSEIASMIIDAFEGTDVKDRVNKFVRNMKMRYYES
ncbi:serine hydroxymethyltransferase [Thermoplasma sp.]|uniref:serine hydroxymethyltransferase n=1 Tax=Thermoplasma sp. TaxID=1973142 RepID=UPI001280CC82|nr:serine hydroxymethyltransferase [Thermoplasma sp.]KAA8921890.1 MAG: serine hydroxymethyltransferase [Thermoplasma sp.]